MNEALSDKFKLVGQFGIQVLSPDGEVLSEFYDQNKIVDNVPFQFSRLIAGETTPDLNIVTIALGTGGTLSGTPKEVPGYRNRLFSEADFWDNGPVGDDTDVNKYVYQTTFDIDSPINSTPKKLIINNEGGTFPETNSIPDSFRGAPGAFPEESFDGTIAFNGYSIKYEFLLGQLRGNGLNTWADAPAFSEAALYMSHNSTSGPTVDLGTIFSMKTFPDHIKTEDCYIKITWELIFG